jgi:molybdate transport repressor ModE-like protein
MMWIAYLRICHYAPTIMTAGAGSVFRVEIEPVLRFARGDDVQSMHSMLEVLDEIRVSGKITRAAQRTHLSYRHVWNLIEQWSAFFNAPLVERRRGRGTTLTAFGDRLVWAGRRLQARLQPQLANLAEELETEVRPFLPHDEAIIRIHASHGFAVAALRSLLMRHSGLDVALRYVANQTSLMSLVRNECDLAGIHLPQGPLRKESIQNVKGFLQPAKHSVIGFVTREMGLIVKRDNPLGIATLRDLVNPAVRFVNRDPESGTAQLLDRLLRQEGVDRRQINGYGQIEFTHAAVAAYVASGMADVSFGVEAAARQFDLDFIRLVTEDYVFVCLKQMLQTPHMQTVLTAMCSEDFARQVSALPGYALKDTGVVRPIQQVFA